MGSISSYGVEEPRKRIVIFWGVMMGAVAAVMLLAGGEDPSEALTGLQQITIVAALPFVVVMVGMCIALTKDLYADPLILRHKLASSVVDPQHPLRRQPARWRDVRHRDAAQRGARPQSRRRWPHVGRRHAGGHRPVDPEGLSPTDSAGAAAPGSRPSGTPPADVHSPPAGSSLGGDDTWTSGSGTGAGSRTVSVPTGCGGSTRDRPLLDAAGPLEILSHRIVWSLVLAGLAAAGPAPPRLVALDRPAAHAAAADRGGRADRGQLGRLHLGREQRPRGGGRSRLLHQPDPVGAARRDRAAGADGRGQWVAVGLAGVAVLVLAVDTGPYPGSRLSWRSASPGTGCEEADDAGGRARLTVEPLVLTPFAAGYLTVA